MDSVEMSTAMEFAANVQNLLANGSYDAVARSFATAAKTGRIHSFLKEFKDDFLRDICMKNLDARTYEENSARYNCADEILKQVATYAPSENLLIELLELIEELQQHYQFSTLLRSLQALLLNYGDEKAKAYDWAFNTVHGCLEQRKLPDQLTNDCDNDQAQLLEQNDIVEDILSRYITIGLFYGPLKDHVLKQSCEQTIFRDCSLKRRRNLLCCFIVQLLWKPLALLDLTVTDERNTNCYTLQVVRGLTHDLTALMIDPYYFLTIVEDRERWNRPLDSSKGVYEMSSKNVFLIQERLPLEGLAIYYYILFLDPTMQKDMSEAPVVYAPDFIFESCLYLVNKLFGQEEAALHLRGLLLADRALNVFMVNRRIPVVALELDVHKAFCGGICTFVGYSTQATLRRISTMLLKKYILTLDDEGRYLVLSNIMPGLAHKGLKSYLSTLYKDIVAELLNTTPITQHLPAEYRGKLFKKLLLNVICRLERGVETDLLENAEQISAALNIVRYFALSDSCDRTGFWKLEEELQTRFFQPLQKALDYSIAHYKLEARQLETNWDIEKQKQESQRASELVTININNNEGGILPPEALNKERKLDLLNQNLTTFDLIRSLLARTVELIDQASKKRRMQSNQEA